MLCIAEIMLDPSARRRRCQSWEAHHFLNALPAAGTEQRVSHSNSFELVEIDFKWTDAPARNHGRPLVSLSPTCAVPHTIRTKNDGGSAVSWNETMCNARCDRASASRIRPNNNHNILHFLFCPFDVSTSTTCSGRS